MNIAQYAKGEVIGQVINNNAAGLTSVRQMYATQVRTGETYRAAVLRLSASATSHFTRNHNTGGRRPTFREIPGGPFVNPGGAIVLP